MQEFKRGMQVAFDAVKDGKAHTRKSLRLTFKKNGLKKAVTGRMRRLGRIGRAEKEFDIVIKQHESDPELATFQLVKGAAMKKSIAEKAERYANLAKARKSSKKPAKARKSGKKTTAKKTTKKVKKASTKKAHAHAGGSGSSEESAEGNASASS